MATLLMYGDIVNNENKTEMGGFSSIDVANFLEKNKDAKDITVRINSRGGSVQEGFLIYDLLKNCGKPVTTIGEGKIYSIATVVFLAGDERIMLENATGLIHMPFIPPDTLADSYDSKELSTLTEMLKQEEEKILNFYSEHTKYDKSKLRDFMDKETMLSAQDMVDLGFATKIQQPLKAVAYFNFNNKKNEKMTEDVKKFDGLLSKLEKFVNSFSRISPKAMDLTDVNGNPFNVVREEGEIQVGDEASPDGTYVLEDGSTVVIAEGKIESITPAEAPGEIEELKQEIADLKAQLAEKDAATVAMQEDLVAKKAEAIELVASLKGLKSTVSIVGRQQSFKSTAKSTAVDMSKVEENLKKLKEGK